MINVRNALPGLTPSEASALWTLKLISVSQLSDVGEALLQEGFDTPALRGLVALDNGDDSAGREFEKSLTSLGQAKFLDARDAALFLIGSLARRITDGTVGAYLGAKAIWEISSIQEVGVLKEAHPFIYAASEYEDRPEDREFFVRAIEQEAKILISADVGNRESM